MIVFGELAATINSNSEMIWVRAFHADNARYIGYLVARADNNPPLAIHTLFSDGNLENEAIRCELRPGEQAAQIVFSKPKSSVLLMGSLGLKHPTYLPRDN